MIPTYALYSQYTDHVIAGHFNMIPFPTPTTEQLAAENVVLSPSQQESYDFTAAFYARGIGYFDVQSTKARCLSQI